ncbi:MAG: hypothetical protein Q4A50_01590 [Bacteroidales bacterium]|nr:hypothetical protein [Bacteroidales bacterium]
MSIIKKLSFLLVLLTSITACSNEDDIEDILVGRTWYMNGATINGMKLNSEIKNFYTDAGENAYFISFSAGTFTGVLSEGVHFSGTWSANGKKQTISMTVKKQPATQSTFDKQIYKIISSVTSYNSGADFLRLQEDKQNFILLGSSRSKIYN